MKTKKLNDEVDLFNSRMLTAIRLHLYKNKRIGIKQYLKLDSQIWNEVKNENNN